MQKQTNILKIFSGCGQKFDVWCLSTRYILHLEVTSFLLIMTFWQILLRYNGKVGYDLNTATAFVCPACKNICTCDKCTLQWGEVYVLMRGLREISAAAMVWSLSEEKSATRSPVVFFSIVHVLMKSNISMWLCVLHLYPLDFEQDLTHADSGPIHVYGAREPSFCQGKCQSLITQFMLVAEDKTLSGLILQPNT